MGRARRQRHLAEVHDGTPYLMERGRPAAWTGKRLSATTIVLIGRMPCARGRSESPRWGHTNKGKHSGKLLYRDGQPPRFAR